MIGWRIGRIAGQNKTIRREKGELRIHVAGHALNMELPFRAKGLPGRFFTPGEQVEYLVRPLFLRRSRYLVLAYRRASDESMRAAGLGFPTILFLLGTLFWGIMFWFGFPPWRELELGEAATGLLMFTWLGYGGWRLLETWYALGLTRVEDVAG